MTAVLTLGGMLKCSQALPPGQTVLLGAPTSGSATMMPTATVSMCVPLVNIATFGMCNSSTNPMVIAATAAALGVHTPMPCIPVIAGLWSPGAANISIDGQQAALETSKCMCSWAGEITVTQTSGQPLDQG